MGKPYRRFRIKRGPNTWDNVTQSSSGTKTSRSNKNGNTTTNVSRTRITTHQNNSGWIIRKSRPMFPKYKSKSSPKRKTRKSSGKSIFDFFFSKKKKRVNKPVNKPETKSWFDSIPSDVNEEKQLSLTFEEKARIIAEKQAAKARAAQEARKRPVTIVSDEEAGFTPSQKRFLLISLCVIIFIIQKCTG